MSEPSAKWESESLEILLKHDIPPAVIEDLKREGVSTIYDLDYSLDFGETFGLKRVGVMRLQEAVAKIKGEPSVNGQADIPSTEQLADAISAPVTDDSSELVIETQADTSQTTPEPEQKPPEIIQETTIAPESPRIDSDAKSPSVEPSIAKTPESQPEEKPATNLAVQETYADAYMDLRRRIILQTTKLDQLRRAQLKAAEEHKKLKKGVEAAEEELEALVRSEFEPAQGLFSNPVPVPPDDPDATVPDEAPPNVSERAESSKNSAPVEAPAAPVEDMRWREVPLTRWLDPDINPDGELKPRHLNALHDHEKGIDTVGALTDYQALKPNGWQPSLTDIKGISAAGRDVIKTCEERFWAVWKNNRESLFTES